MRRPVLSSPRALFSPLLALAVSFLAGCDLTSADDARVQIQITDAPADYIESAEVWISHVYLNCEDEDDDEHEGEHVFAGPAHESGATRTSGRDHDDDHGDDDDDEGDDEHCERIDLLSEDARDFHVDLLDLQNGLVTNLTVPVDLPEGRFVDLFVVVDSAFVTLKPPFKFSNGSRTMSLHLADRGRRTIKVELAEPLDLEAGQTTLVLVDFDVDESFRLLGNPNVAGGLTGVLFVPHLRERQRSHHDD